MVCHNLSRAYLLELNLMQLPTNHETLFANCHVVICVVFASMIVSLRSWVFTSYCEVNLDGLNLFDQ